MGYQFGLIDPAMDEVSEPQADPELLKEPSAPDQLNEQVAQAVIAKKSRHKGPNLKTAYCAQSALKF
jgi:hypothetical protein